MRPWRDPWGVSESAAINQIKIKRKSRDTSSNHFDRELHVCSFGGTTLTPYEKRTVYSTASEKVGYPDDVDATQSINPHSRVNKRTQNISPVRMLVLVDKDAIHTVFARRRETIRG